MDITDESLIARAFELFDRANSEDPNIEHQDGSAFPKELLYSWRMTKRLSLYNHEAGTALRLAARAQHICRWKSPRSGFPMDRIGYLRWRTELKKFHADTAGAILTEVGYSNEIIERTQTLIRKENLTTDPEAQVLEDVICLVFLEYYFDDFAQKHEPDKVIDIVKKTWKKMSENGHQAALGLDYTPESLNLIKAALGL
jgi:hypothetical protein